MPECRSCGRTVGSRSALRDHWMTHHSGEVETPEEHLPDVESEQRDFDGEHPDESEHDPEYEVTNDPDGGEVTQLREWEDG